MEYNVVIGYENGRDAPCPFARKANCWYFRWDCLEGVNLL